MRYGCLCFGAGMKRTEAVGLLEDIFGVWGEQIVMEMMYLRQTYQPIQGSENDEYQVVVKANLDKSFRECLEPILERRDLALKVEKGYIIFYTAQ